mgnify:CR=1 FL=1
MDYRTSSPLSEILSELHVKGKPHGICKRVTGLTQSESGIKAISPHAESDPKRRIADLANLIVVVSRSQGKVL